jgi:hypothetical protein
LEIYKIDASREQFLKIGARPKFCSYARHLFFPRQENPFKKAAFGSQLGIFSTLKYLRKKYPLKKAEYVRTIEISVLK